MTSEAEAQLDRSKGVSQYPLITLPKSLDEKVIPPLNKVELKVSYCWSIAKPLVKFKRLIGVLGSMVTSGTT